MTAVEQRVLTLEKKVTRLMMLVDQVKPKKKKSRSEKKVDIRKAILKVK